MTPLRPNPGSLALYKIRPALITQIGEKIDIVLEGGKTKRVRPKDIAILHPGPLADLSDLTAADGNLDEAWELLMGDETHLQELTELIYGEFTPATAWAAWQTVAEGLYFEGIPEKIKARSVEQVEADIAERQAKATRQQEWQAFLQRMRLKQLEEGDRERLSEVELLALEKGERSRILQALGHQETPVNAHRMLCGVGYWAQEHNPYPRRQGLAVENPLLELPEWVGGLSRLDLTHLEAYAIDDEGSEDPDDAITLDGERIWVHVADVAALVAPDSEIDREARSRAANLYLPEKIVHMLPVEITHMLGLGLQETSPALSISFCLDDEAQPVDIQVAISRIRVTRHTYAEIDGRMDEPAFSRLNALCQRFRRQREAAGASRLELPEVSVRLTGGEIVIRPLERIDSRDMVTELMLLAGTAVARYAQENAIPIAYAMQPPPERPAKPEGMAAMYAYRRQMRPSRSSIQVELHAGLGLEAYCRVTSPLRRYLDLVTHQQLHCHLAGRPLLSSTEVSERIAVTDGVSRTVRRVERSSNMHWKLLYLMRHPNWQGTGVVVESTENRAKVIIPELALETRIRLRDPCPLDSQLRLAVREIDLEDQVVWFRLLN